MLVGVGVISCGGVGHDGLARNRAVAAARSAVDPSAVPVELTVSGDDDPDDYASSEPVDDGDDDDHKLPYKDADGDADSRSGRYFDRDDEAVRRYGHAAGAADALAIMGLVRRYFAAAASGNGGEACSMIVAKRVEQIPETLGQFGPPYLRGDTCAMVMAKLFQANHRQMTAHLPTLLVSGVRVAGDVGLAVLAYKDLPGREVVVKREAGGWKLESLLDKELP
jgi:hypothetical protein